MVIEYREGKTLTKVLEEQKDDSKIIETETVVHILSQLVEILKFLWDNF